MAEVDIAIAGRTYRIACRDGEEDNLRAAAAMVDSKSREALAGLGTLSEARQMMFAALLLADQLIDKKAREQPSFDPALAQRAEILATQLETLASALEDEARPS